MSEKFPAMEAPSLEQRKFTRSTSLRRFAPLIMAVGSMMLAGASEAEAQQRYQNPAKAIQESAKRFKDVSMDAAIREMPGVLMEMEQIAARLDAHLRDQGMHATKATSKISVMDRARGAGMSESVVTTDYSPTAKTSPEFRLEIQRYNDAQARYMMGRHAQLERSFETGEVKR